MSWLQEQNRAREDYKDEGKYQRKITLKSILCNKSVKGWLFITAFACSAPILVYYLVIDQGTYKTSDSYTCLVQETFRVPCGKVNITSGNCENIQCCFDKISKLCFHYLPSKYSYDLDKAANEYIAAQSKTPFGTDSVKKLKISINEIDSNRVSIILHQDNVTVEANSTTVDKNYNVNLVQEKLMVEVYRKNHDLLLSTAKGPLIASEKYWEWSFYLTNQSLFGLNQTLISVEENSTLSKVIYKNKDDHYTLPVLWAYKNKQFHSVAIKHDGPIEITVLPSNMVILRSLTGEKIELVLSVGPTPRELHDQQLDEFSLPPSWTLETHTCRRGNNINLTELIQNYNLNNETNSDCIHENLLIGIMNDSGRNIEGIRNIVTQIKEQGMNLILSVPPHIFVNATTLYNKAESLGLLYKYNQTVYKGKYMNEEVVYPDYSNSTIQAYIEEFNTFLSTYINVSDVDGFVLYDNWPVDENYYLNNTEFPYFTEDLEAALSNTLPWNSTVNNGSSFHITTHNNYGSAQMSSLISYYINAKPDLFIMSASKIFGETQPSTIQNINASWTNLELHIDNILFNSIVGNHLVSVPICGDTTSYNKSLQETLCIRWYLVAATMPLFRISSAEPWRDPQSLNTLFAKNAAVKAIAYRQMLLPYYYTLLSKNEPVIRPLFYDYYENTTTFSLEGQYMIGEDILIAHPLSAGRTKLQVFLPSRIGIWYELWGGKMYNTTVDAWASIDIVETDFVGFVAQGSVVPLKIENTLNLIIALNCTANPCEANGTLFLENYVDFVANETAVTVINMPEINCNYTVGNIKLYFYTNDTSDVVYYNKSEDLCTGESSITLNFQTEDEIGTFMW